MKCVPKGPGKSEVHRRACKKCGQFGFGYRLKGENFDRFAWPQKGLVPGEKWEAEPQFCYGQQPKDDVR
jgi:hypothetical protein